jgi:aspartyl-tRNA(Asn)/glutamyl-tRNA(Gln) amidotransferase subunit A
MVSDDVLYMTVEELGPQIKAKRISPVELTEAYLGRLERLGPKVGAIATVMRDQAMSEARAAEKEISGGKYRGPLHGIPYGAKDLLATKGVPTTWGAPPFKDQVFDYDATVIRKLRDAGAILIAKLAMIELAGGGGYSNAAASLQGPSRCPFNTDYWAGGSSSGPGAAVPSALVGFAIGSETQGSIITPCAYSGVSGLRPTYGRVSRAGAMALSWTMDKLGPMCRSAADCSLVLEAIAGHDAADASSLEGSEYPRRGSAMGRTLRAPGRLFGGGKSKTPLAGKRLGYFMPNFSAANAEVKAAYEAALEALRGLGAALIQTELPDFPYGAVSGAMINGEGATIFRPLIESGKIQELVDERQKVGLIAALELPAVDYLDAMRIRAEILPAVGKMFETVDALVAPSRNNTASKIDADIGGGPPPPARVAGQRPAEERPAERPPTPPPGGAGAGNRQALIAASNLAGLPAISVPCGFAKETNLPIGIQFVCDAMRDETCVELAVAYQSATEWHRKRPAM